VTYAPSADQREQEHIIGTVVQIVQKQGGKFQAQVQPDGAANTKNLWIGEDKAQEFLPFLSSQIGNRLAFLCNVSHWTNQQHQQVRSLWIDQIGMPQAGPPAQAVVPPPTTATMVHPPATVGQPVVVQPTVEPMVAQAPQQDLREQKIHRQSASKVAAILLGYLPEGERTLSTLLVLSERLVAYYDTGMPAAETLDQLMNRAMPASMDEAAAQGTGYGNTPPPPGDDDIPF